jgi:UDP-N-acetylmuramoyl-L-alanyl-D-glutamate--2,6-diaminopimelate ligase
VSAQPDAHPRHHRPKTLGAILAAIEPLQVRADPAIPVAGLVLDSRQAFRDSVFVCIRGFRTDGHVYVGDAVARGATAVVGEDPATVAALPAGVGWVRVADSRRAAALLANAFYDTPSADLVLVGVTGTNGKTTTVLFTDAIWRSLGRRTGVIGTLGWRIADQAVEAERTTPEGVDFQRALRSMADAGVTHVTMEVSSHALELHRILGARFDAAVFTNLTRDHLDFHADEEHYLAAKVRLFAEYADAGLPEKRLVGVVNLDDPAAPAILDRARCQVRTFALCRQAQLRGEHVAIHDRGASFAAVADGRRVRTRIALPGAFNVSNALAAMATATALGVDLEAAAEGVAGLESVPGRFESVDEGQDFRVIIDYAHSPDGLGNVLRAARQITRGRLICVFGCGGDRDAGKRPKMGRIASELADLTIVTSDNPRSEDPHAIISQITAGMVHGGYTTEEDREQAIRQAIAACGPGDVVVVAGKGHETHQVFRDRTIHFDDRDVARRALRDASP